MKKLNVTFDDVLNNNKLGYVLGVIVGDGYIERTSIVLTATDKDFVLRFKKELESLFKLKTKMYFLKGRKKTHKDYIRVKLCSIEASKMLKFLRLTFFEYKFPKEMARNFIQGFVDSEGNVGIREIRISNTKLGLLQYIQNLLKQFNIISRIRKQKKSKNPKWKQPYMLFVSGYENIKIFNKEIGFGILRKQEKLKETINNYNTIPKEIFLKIGKMRKQKTTYREIGEKLEIPEETIYSWHNKLRNPRLK